jgi:hypothetical protein
MVLKFPALSESELGRVNLIEPGIYKFKVDRAIDKISSNGNEMISMMLKIFLSNEKTFSIWDNLVVHENMLFKIRHFCNTTEQLDVYQKGILSANDCIGKFGYCEIGCATDKRSNQERNIVIDYIKTEVNNLQNMTIPSKQKDFEDDEIPF